MITTEPAITSATMSTPNAKRRAYGWVLSGPVVIVQEEDQNGTPIWAIARTAKPDRNARRPEQRRVGYPRMNVAVRRRPETVRSCKQRMGDVSASCGRPGWRRVARVRDHTVLWSWAHSHQVDDREQPDPDDVERVPETGEKA